MTEPPSPLRMLLSRHTKRREFITLLGGAAAAWPLAARAQQAERMRRIGVLCLQPRTMRNVRPASAAFLQGLQQLGWTDRPQRADRHSLGRGRCRPTFADTRRNWSRSRRTSSWPMAARRGAVAAGDPHRADRVRGRRRSGRRRLRRQPGAAGRQRHRLHDVRIRHRREMAGAAQADRAERDASGGPSGCRQALRDRPVRRHPGRGAVARGGGEPGQRARRRRDRARRRGLRALLRMAV